MEKVVPGKAAPLGKYPHVKRVGDFVFVSGTSSRRPDGSIAGATVDESGTVVTDIGEQTRAVLDNVASILEAFGATLGDVVDVTTFLVDMGDFDGYNTAYGDYFDYDGPTRTTVAVHQLPHPHLAIEIKVIAWLNPAGPG
jgi:2-aminomuconate deaminase